MGNECLGQTNHVLVIIATPDPIVNYLDILPQAQLRLDLSNLGNTDIVASAQILQDRSRYLRDAMPAFQCEDDVIFIFFSSCTSTNITITSGVRHMLPKLLRHVLLNSVVYS